MTQVTKLTTFDKYLLSQLAATALGVAVAMLRFTNQHVSKAVCLLKQNDIILKNDVVLFC